MTQLSVYKLPDGQGQVLVEAAELPSSGGEDRASIETLGKYLNAKSGQSVDDLESGIAPIVAALKAVQEKIAVISPDELELEAGLKFVAEAGIVLSKYGAEASISVKLKWRRKPDQSVLPTQQPSPDA
jgi:hypothetical protein